MNASFNRIQIAAISVYDSDLVEVCSASEFTDSYPMARHCS